MLTRLYYQSELFSDVMNFSLLESAFGRQRCQQWTPLFTQQVFQNKKLANLTI